MTTQQGSVQLGRRILANVAMVVTAFAAGLGTFWVLSPQLMPSQDVVKATDDEQENSVTSPAEDVPDTVVELSDEIVGNLNLYLGEVELDDHWQEQLLPGEVVEVPGQSDLSVSAPVAGVIEAVDIRIGESVGPGELLFTLRINDPLVTNAQAELLNVLSQLDVARKEIDRLSPLAAEGAVSSKRSRELKYQVQNLESQRATKSQEILARGVPSPVLATVLETRQLASRIEIPVPIYSNSGRVKDVTKLVFADG